MRLEKKTGHATGLGDFTFYFLIIWQCSQKKKFPLAEGSQRENQNIL